MAMAVQVSLIGTDRVVDRALAIYRAHYERTAHVPLGDMVDCEIGIDAARLSAVAAVDKRVVEIAVDESVVCEQLIPAVWSLAGQGWGVNVVLPAPRMGEGHLALRGVPCTLQPWWEDDAAVAFGAYETP